MLHDLHLQQQLLLPGVQSARNVYKHVNTFPGLDLSETHDISTSPAQPYYGRWGELDHLQYTDQIDHDASASCECLASRLGGVQASTLFFWCGVN